jgi:hypothetical protein
MGGSLPTPNILILEPPLLFYPTAFSQPAQCLTASEVWSRRRSDPYLSVEREDGMGVPHGIRFIQPASYHGAGN